MVDVHPHPEAALVDGPQALDDPAVEELGDACRRLAALLGRRTE